VCPALSIDIACRARRSAANPPHAAAAAVKSSHQSDGLHGMAAVYMLDSHNCSKVRIQIGQ